VVDSGLVVLDGHRAACGAGNPTRAFTGVGARRNLRLSTPPGLAISETRKAGRLLARLGLAATPAAISTVSGTFATSAAQALSIQGRS